MNRLLLLVLIIALAGCAPVYKSEYNYAPPNNQMGKMCIAQCVQAKANCEQMCQINNANCRAQRRQEAFYQYETYKYERHRQGRKLKKNINDFDTGSYSCSHSCNCVPSFNACYAACGGEVLERKVCVAFCNL